MPTPHIGAQRHEIAPLVLMPGDPHRAGRMAADLLIDPTLVTEIRGIEGYTGRYRGEPMTVMASGMGVPSMTIYATELYRDYDVRRIIRVGTAGALQADLGLGDTVIATHAHTDSSAARAVPGVTLSATATPGLVVAAARAAEQAGDRPSRLGAVLTSDHFYLSRPELFAGLTSLGVLAVEMEAAGLFLAAEREKGEALAVLTISDHVVTGAAMSAEERETGYTRAAQLAALTLLS